jgi:mono/diheme cytochrome c family protein
MSVLLLAGLLLTQFCTAQVILTRPADTMRRLTRMQQNLTPTDTMRHSPGMMTPVTMQPATFRPPVNTMERAAPLQPISEPAAASEVPNARMVTERTPRFRAPMVASIRIDSGKLLYQQQCASCHHPGKELTGPALSGVRARVPGYVIHEYLQHPESQVFKNDPYFRQLQQRFPIVHPSFPVLSETQVKSILSYADQAAPQAINASGSQSLTISKTSVREAGMQIGATPIKLGDVRFAFATDTVMQVGKSYVASLVLSSSLDVLQEQLTRIAQRDQPDSVFTWDKALLKKYIAANLQSQDKETFHIEPILETGARVLDSGSYLKWSWNLIPQKENPKAVLVVGLYFSHEKFSELKLGDHIDEEYHTVQVQSVPASVPTVVGNFFSRNWQYLLTTLFIPIFIWLYNRREKRKKKNESTVGEKPVD